MSIEQVFLEHFIRAQFFALWNMHTRLMPSVGLYFSGERETYMHGKFNIVKQCNLVLNCKMPKSDKLLRTGDWEL